MFVEDLGVFATTLFGTIFFYVSVWKKKNQPSGSGGEKDLWRPRRLERRCEVLAGWQMKIYQDDGEKGEKFGGASFSWLSKRD